MFHISLSHWIWQKIKYVSAFYISLQRNLNISLSISDVFADWDLNLVMESENSQESLLAKVSYMCYSSDFMIFVFRIWWNISKFLIRSSFVLWKYYGFLNSRTQCDALYDQICVIFNVGLWFSKHAAAVAGKDEYVNSPFYYLMILLISLIERCFTIVTFHSFFSRIIDFGIWNIMQWCCFFTLLLMFLVKGQRWRRRLKCTNAWELLQGCLCTLR